ncbi:DUF1003 domain-containing protein [Pseudomonas sp. o96-267]|uniref:DUF1003 domain-containing protein n=1 Tax=Pseudomonas sp. o96-267 TaxID=2479853 RepID=UPI000F76BAEC|nr:MULTISPECIES: DUF1003 domain-containing protein [Pseudomonas]RRV36760.1 DUF1003 domain-containing protein [Pseudomonas sp. o96-267]TRO18938.1 DUF1003 domain-containing protein [Pseudomonas mendocina]TRO19947.1 DUF1003 domain-containing protein [Pseudomonas mendocina]
MSNDTSHPLQKLAQNLLGKAIHELEPEESHVLEQIRQRRPISRDAADASDEQSSFGERLSDRVASVGGSWTFIICFSLTMLGWMLLNTDVLSHFGMAFDPYPYIFLNLMLSTLAAIQAPIIMMSQNRQAAKDRLAASLDFEVNLRAELEIMRLHEKIDQRIQQRLDQILERLPEKRPQD